MNIDIGNAAQWFTAVLALLFGTRAEIRARRERREAKNEAAAFAQLLTILSRAEEILPAKTTADLVSQIRANRGDLKQLSMASRQAVESVVAFPDATGGLFDFSDWLEDVIRLTESAGSSEEIHAKALDVCWKLNQILLLLSVTASRRAWLRGDLVTEPFAQDRYYKEFTARYENFRAEILRNLNFPGLA